MEEEEAEERKRGREEESKKPRGGSFLGRHRGNSNAQTLASHFPTRSSRSPPFCSSLSIDRFPSLVAFEGGEDADGGERLADAMKDDFSLLSLESFFFSATERRRGRRERERDKKKIKNDVVVDAFAFPNTIRKLFFFSLRASLLFLLRSIKLTMAFSMRATSASATTATATATFSSSRRAAAPRSSTVRVVAAASADAATKTAAAGTYNRVKVRYFDLSFLPYDISSCSEGTMRCLC